MAGAEGEPGLDLNGEVADAATVTVMRAVNEESRGAYGLQPFERTRDPIDVRHFLTRQRQGLAVAAQDFGDLARRFVAIAVGIERNFPGFRRPVEFDDRQGQAAFLECGLKCSKDSLGGIPACGEKQPCLGHACLMAPQPSATSRFSFSIAVSAFSP